MVTYIDSVEHQRTAWDALGKSINALMNKVNATNVKHIVPDLFAENLIRGRGLFCRSCITSQMSSPAFTDVFAALVAVVNSKFPEIGHLLLRRIVLDFQSAYKRNDKPRLLATVKFIAHLVNQQVVHEIIALEILMLLLEKPTDDSADVAVRFVAECGSALEELSPQGLNGIFDRFREIHHEGDLDKRALFLIEEIFALRKAKFQIYPAVRPELDLVEEEDQFTHQLSLLDENIDPEVNLDIFNPDPNFSENEKRYQGLRKQLLGEDEEEEEKEEDDGNSMNIKTDLISLRRTMYLMIMSSVDFEEAANKLLRMKVEAGQEMEVCVMVLKCCGQERSYLTYYGLLGQRLCMTSKVYRDCFDECFVGRYPMIRRAETDKLRNLAKFYAHLLGTDALGWRVLGYIRLNEDMTCSSRIFTSVLFRELADDIGIRSLNERLTLMRGSLDSVLPKDDHKNTRFAINFFTSIGLGGITEDLREYLKNMQRGNEQQQKSDSGSDSCRFRSSMCRKKRLRIGD